MEKVTISLAGNEFKAFRRGGVGIEILSSSFPVTINTYTAQGGQINTMQAADSGLFMHGAFGAFDIVNTSASPQTVQLLLTDEGEDAGSRRMALSGAVTVADNGLTDTQAGAAFMGGVVIPSNSAQYGGAFLVNAGSKQVIVEQVRVISGYGAASPNLSLTVEASGLSAAGKTQLTGYNFNKDINGAAATAQLWNYTSTTKYTPTKKISLLGLNSAGMPNLPLITSRPLRLMPGQVLGVVQESMDPNGLFPYVTFEWREV